MQENEILPGFYAFGLGLWVEADKCLVISDLHLGIEEMFNRQGSLLPRFNFEEIRKHLSEKVFPNVEPELIIINGDLKHEFGTVSEQEWHEVIDMLGFLQGKCKRLVLVKGNHDSILGPIARWESLKVEEEGFFLEKSKTFVTHGERVPESPGYRMAETVVIGHEHPAVTIREKYKAEQFKAFLVGKFGGKGLVVMPSLNSASMGTDIGNWEVLSPFLQQDLSSFRVFAVADELYDFGRLGELD